MTDTLARKGEALEVYDFDGKPGSIVIRNGVKYRHVPHDTPTKWSKRVNHIMEHGI